MHLFSISMKDRGDNVVSGITVKAILCYFDGALFIFLSSVFGASQLCGVFKTTSLHYQLIMSLSCIIMQLYAHLAHLADRLTDAPHRDLKRRD